MDYSRYLERIKFFDRAYPDDRSLRALHQLHVMHVPFEDLDVHYGRRFDLELENIFKKVVVDFRGGFCYELNYLFNSLLSHIGFSSKIISARTYDSSQMLGPEFDHMAIHVKTDKDYIADVGYGDLFLQPLEIKEGKQSDGRNTFLIELIDDEAYCLSMLDGSGFQKKYVFRLNQVTLEDFRAPCFDKQVNPESYFVKNTVCTRATDDGRVTLFNDKIVQKGKDGRIETQILSDIDLRVQLKKHFGIEIK